MRNWINAAASLVVTVIIVLVIFPWVCGRIIHHELAVWLESFDAPSYGFKLQNYERGWFKSEVTLGLIIKNKRFLDRLHKRGSTISPLKLKLILYHGPLLYFYNKSKSFPATFGLAYGHSKLMVSAKSSYAQYTSPNKVAALRALFRFDGVIKARWVSHEFSFNNPESETAFSWKNLKFSSEFNHKGMEIAHKISFDKFDYQNPSMEVSFGPSHSAQYQSIADHKAQASDYRFDVSSLTVGIKGYPTLYFKGLVTQYHRELLHHITNSAFNLWTKSLIVNQKEFGPANIGLVVDNLNTEALTKFNDLIADYYVNPPQTSSQELAYYKRFKEVLPKLLNHGFQMRVNPVAITLPSGVLSMNAMVTFPNFHHHPVNDLQRMYRRAEMNLQFIVPKVFLKRVLANYFLLEDTEGGIEQKPIHYENLVTHLINTWQSSGVISSGRGDYYFSLTYKRGQVFVNGVPLTLDDLSKDN